MGDRAYDYMDWPRIEGIVYGEETAPRDVMQPRITENGVLVQGFFPGADKVEVLDGKSTYAMELEDEAGYYAVLLPLKKIPQYQFQVTRGSRKEKFFDAYACPCQITEIEERAFCAGVYYKAYEKLGAHPMEIDGIRGTYFAVWAPNAMRVSVVGDFDRWDGIRLPMHRMPMSGIFELFVPGVKAGSAYQYEIKVKGGEVHRKSDPYGNGTQEAPSVISVVEDLRDFSWKDEAWLEKRKKYDSRMVPVSIFETELSQWKNPGELVKFVKDTGYTHVEFHPVMEYLNEESKGYSTSAYYAPTRRFGSPADFQKLVDDLHAESVGVILDWTPAQFPRFDAGLEKFDGTALYEIPDPEHGVHPMWGTMIYNYESPMVKDFLISNACFWMDVYHVDGLRMDDVDAMLYLDFGREAGKWIPNIYGSNENLHALEFLKHLNSILKKRNPGVLLIAQEDGLWPQLTDSVKNDHPGFDYKWSGGWTRDLLSYIETDPLSRKNHYDQLTLSMMYAYSEYYVLTLGMRDVGTLGDFLDRLPGSDREKAAQLREAYAYLTLHPGIKMTAPDREIPEDFREYVRDLNEMYREHPALFALDGEPEGFEWIQFTSYDENVVAFLRKTENPEETLLAVCNFSPVAYENYRVGVPFAGKYKEIFNSDSEKYGGRGMVNPRAKAAVHTECDDREYSLKLRLPAYGVTVFSCTLERKAEKKTPEKSGRRRKTEKKTAKSPSVKSSAAVRKTAEKAVGRAVAKVKETAVEKTSAVKAAVKEATGNK